MSNNGSVAIIMGSKSDLPVMEKAFEVFREFEINFFAQIVSAHRTPEFMFDFAKNAKKNKIDVIIAGAGGAAHLPGMIASITSIPVIGVPINITSMNGLDSMLSIVQMPAGVPVATVGIDNTTNAALLALRILAVSNPIIYTKLDERREKIKNEILNQPKLTNN